MATTVLHRPVILYETLEALYQYVNETWQAERRSRFLAKAAQRSTPDQQHRLGELTRMQDSLMEEVCRDVDREDPRILHFFRRWETENKWQNLCLTKLLVYSFLDITAADWETAVSRLRENADAIFSAPYEIFDVNSGGLSIRPWQGEGQPPELIDQLDQLALEEEYRWTFYKALRRYPRYLEELETLLRPLARRMEQALDRNRPLLEPVYARWERYFADHTFAQFLGNLTDQAVEDDDLDNRVNVSVLAGTDVIYTYQDTLACRSVRQIYIGVLIDENARVNRVQMSHEDLCSLLRIISDRSKFEILCHIARQEAYGQELAKKLGLTTATISRHMAILQDAGLVHTRRSESRVYYRMNRETLQNLLDFTRESLS